MKGHIYILELLENHVKIGRSMNPNKRIFNIENLSGLTAKQRWISEPVDDVDKIERHLHNKFGAHRIRGEYFNIKFELVQRAALLLIQPETRLILYDGDFLYVDSPG